MVKRNSDLCVCSHRRDEHFDAKSPWGTACAIATCKQCTEFRKNKATPKPKAKRKSTVKYAKQAERDVAALISGKRLVSGEHGGAGDIDVTSDRLAVQVKNRAIPDWLLEGMGQIEAAHTGDRLPIVVIVDKPMKRGSRKKRVLAVLDLQQLLALFKEDEMTDSREAAAVTKQGLS